MTRYFIAACAGALIALAGTGLHAQDASAPDPSATEPPVSEDSGRRTPQTVLDEVVVTAQKRSEDILDVPLSVSAIGADTLREKSIGSLDDVANFTPNTKITSRQGSASIKMRGLGSGNNKGFEQAVGFQIDGVYYGRIEYLDNALLDLEQIEILRGPQGTLMGKNNIAGAVSVTTANPQYDWGTDLSVAFGSRNKRAYTAMVTGPILEDTLAFRIAAKRESADGFVENAVSGTDQLNTDKTTVRGKLSFDGIDNLSAVASVEYSKARYDLWGYDIHIASQSNLAAYRLFEPSFKADGDDRINYSDQDGPGDQTMLNTSLKVDYDIGEYTLTSVTGWSSIKYNTLVDVDFGPAPLLAANINDEWKQWSQELRITSPLRTIDYVAGLYFFGSEYLNTQQLGLLRDVAPGSLLATLLPDILAPVGSLLDGLGGSITADETSDWSIQNSFSAAVFGQLRWHITDALTLMGGLRYSYETKSTHKIRTFLNGGLVFRAALGMDDFNVERRRVEHDVSPKVSVSYALAESMTTYATFAQAFKGGGYNATAATVATLEFEPEKADTFEAGFKGRFMGGAIRLNFAAFYTMFDNLQVSIFNGTNFTVTNAASAVTKGFEFDGMAVLAPGLLVNMSLGYTHARYDSFPDGPCTVEDEPPCDLSGRELDRAPEWNGTLGVGYALPLGNWPIEMVVGADINYQGGHYIATDLDEAEFQEGYFLYNARFGFRDIDDVWQIVVHGKNLSDEVVGLSGADVPLMDGSHAATFNEPRFYSAELRVRF